MNIQTTKLRNGTKVLAKKYKGQLSAVTYVNRTQAANRITDLILAGIDAHATLAVGGRAIYIVIE